MANGDNRLLQSLLGLIQQTQPDVSALNKGVESATGVNPFQAAGNIGQNLAQIGAKFIGANVQKTLNKELSGLGFDDVTTQSILGSIGIPSAIASDGKQPQGQSNQFPGGQGPRSLGPNVIGTSAGTGVRQTGREATRKPVLQQGIQQAAPQDSAGLLKRLGNFLGIDPSKGLFSGGGTDEQGNVIPRSGFFGLERESGASLVQRQTAANLRTDAPLGRAKKEEIGLKTAREIGKVLAKQGAEGLKPEQSSKFTGLLEGRDDVIDIDSLLFGDGFTGKIFEQNLPTLLKSQRGRQLEIAIERAIQMKTRIETGAAMQPDELKSTAKRFKPKAGESEATARKKLRPLFDFLIRSIAIADPSGIHEQRAKGSPARFLANQVDVEQIKQAIQEARKRGLLG